MNDDLILGSIEPTRSLWLGVKGLFDHNLPHNRAVRRCLESFKRKQQRKLIRLTNAVHTAVFAPTGGGKGVCVVIPKLLTCKDSMVVIDLKGENYTRTAGHRRRMGHNIVCVDPFRTVMGTGAMNPMANIDPHSDFAPDECRELAEMIITRTGKENDP
jgi:type IV secretion system protein VirD4